MHKESGRAQCVAVKPEPPLTSRRHAPPFALEYNALRNARLSLLLHRIVRLFGAFGRTFSHEDAVGLSGIVRGILPLGMDDGWLSKNLSITADYKFNCLKLPLEVFIERLEWTCIFLCPMM